MKKIIIFIVFLCFFVLSGCEDVNPDPMASDNDYVLTHGGNFNSDYLYSSMRLYCGSEEIPVYNCKVNYSHSWDPEAASRINNGVAIISLKGKARFSLLTNFNILERCTIRPLNMEVPLEFVEDKRVDFVISKPGQYTIELSNDRTLHLFVNEVGAYDEYKNMSNVLYFGPGIHNRNNNKAIGSDNFIHPDNNSIIFIDEGAIVEAGIIANNKSNIIIVGNGILSGAKFKRSATTNEKLIPFEFNYCSNIKFLGVSTLDPAGWCYNLYFCNDILLDNIKIISSRANGDGVSVQSCSNVECSNSFVRSWDDSLVVKNYPRWDNRNNEGTTRNVKFKNCLIWTDLAQSMEVGFETVGSVMEDISFEDITVLHNYHKAVISMHNANNANIKRVTYKNIIVEDAAMGKGDGNNTLIELTCEYSATWSNGHKVTGLGSVDGVIIENVKVLRASNPLITIRGSVDSRNGYSKEPHMISNVLIKDLYIQDNKIDSTYDKLSMTYCENVRFE